MFIRIKKTRFGSSPGKYYPDLSLTKKCSLNFFTSSKSFSLINAGYKKNYFEK
jgi:hypothetical protein